MWTVGCLKRHWSTFAPFPLFSHFDWIFYDSLISFWSLPALIAEFWGYGFKLAEPNPSASQGGKMLSVSQPAFAKTEQALWVKQSSSSTFPFWAASALAQFLWIVTVHPKEGWGCRAEYLGKSLREAHHLLQALCACAYTSVWLQTGLSFRFISVLTAHKSTCLFFPWVFEHVFLVDYCH